jgi:formylglycine-generating enzyme required for sulfatase activity
LNEKSKTPNVGTKQVNELEIHDMSGNVWEWCNDWFNADYYKNSPQRNPQGPSSGYSLVSHGGSWNGGAQFCRVAYRFKYYPDISFNALGFRLALSFQ